MSELNLNRDISNEYINWIKANTKFNDVHKSLELSTPFVDFLGDNIKIYVEEKNGKFRITDDGYTIWSLESLGIPVKDKSNKRNKMLHALLDKRSINFESKTDELYLTSTKKEIGQRIHQMIQSIINVSDLMYVHNSTVRSLFNEEVHAYLQKNIDNYDFTPDIRIDGRSNLSYKFDFLMNTKKRQKKVVKVYNNFQKSNVESILASWLDTREERQKNYNDDLRMAVIINDQNRPISSDYESALKQYDIPVIPFSNKKILYDELSFTS